MDGVVWKVIGGVSAGGILVRTHRGIASPEANKRLSTGSFVKQLALERGRLQYELIAGEGPPTGWITVTVGGRQLLVPVPADEAAQPLRLGAAAASRRRIEAAAGSWHEVLGVAPSASAWEVRRAFRVLALLHHPDKRSAAGEGGDSGEAFRAVQRACEQGLAEASRGSMEVRVPVPTEVRVPCPVPINAPRLQLHAACEDFEDKVDQGKSKSVPDDIPYVDVDQLAEWLLEGSCITIDAREPAERFGINAEMLPRAVPLGYTRLLKSPETLLPELACLKTHADSGLQLVSYSTHGTPSNGNCAIVCCLLVDVFGFNAELMHCLEDGYLMWRQWGSKHKEAVDKIRARYSAV
mmetsp:Transcript_81849/g.226838  ORF Transcript_81849/g.226838 Transcript_81849/m.226838 type:complete len:352 (+) Transcript_81849:80-1135(+)